MNALSEALQSGSILLREGLEALLVIAALAAFLTRAGVPEK
jgi:high-affinity iron transporter